MIRAALALSLLASPAAAQVVCGPRDGIVAQLEDRYGETRRSIGSQGGHAVVEVYASDKTGSWTIIVTDTKGRTCLMAAGDGFEALTPAPNGERL